MKKLIIILMAVVFCVSATVSWAAPEGSKTLTVSASVNSGAPEIDIVILSKVGVFDTNNPYNGATVVTGAMKLDFGALIHVFPDGPAAGQDAGIWFSRTGYMVHMFPQGFGRKYEVRSLCTGLSGAGTSLPAGSFGLTPVYEAKDTFKYPDGSLHAQGALPSGASVGAAGPAISATYKKVYASQPAPSTPQIIQAFYGISPKTALNADPWPGWQGIPLNQAAGTYAGTVVISIVSI